MRLAELSGRRVAVWGIGREGRAAARTARATGAAEVVAVVDADPGPAERKTWADAGLADIDVLVGPPGLDTAATSDVLLLSPSISRYRDDVVQLERQGVTVANGTELFLAERGADTVAVTGTKGKSTVTRLAAHLFTALGRDTTAAGNVGVPLLDLIDDPRPVVAEISSYQAALVRSGPALAVLTSLFPEHLPWHGSVERYYGDKLRLFSAHELGSRLVNGADAGVRSLLDSPELAGASTFGTPESEVQVEDDAVVVRGERVVGLDRSPLLGAHNRLNVAAAVAVLDRSGLDVLASRDDVTEALAGFSPLPHRLQPVGVVEGVTFVDDSLATTPQAAVAACEAFPSQPITLLLGGLDRGLDYQPLTEYLEDRSAASPVGVVLMGPVGRRLAASLRGPKTATCDDVAEAVRAAAELTPTGGVVLLAPAAASPTEYGNYEARAEAFRQGVDRLRRQPGAGQSPRSAAL